ncbi:flagellar motor switch protein FliN [Dissulfurimicrobium hydrothermale]|nr:flagellar motor switch protein FliN [Dissulfurimicrobium hydrothermale]UKL13473.1 flagellar motor switch protein FliN [Dissulfurimicrobium hydrothermale]
MLTQEELDKLLAEGSDGIEGQKASGGQQGDPAKTGEVAQEPPKAPEESGTIDWSQAFNEAAAGGDKAAAKAVRKGTVETSQDKPADAKQQNQGAGKPKFDEFQRPAVQEEGGAGKPDLNFILDIPLDISVELGRTRLQIRELLQLGQGSVVSLDKLAGEPADIYVNQKLMAKGDIVVVNEKFGIKLTEIISPADRVKNLGSQKY